MGIVISLEPEFLRHSSIPCVQQSTATAYSDPKKSAILFSKSIKVNESGIKGYYADVTLENHSKKRVELFAISSEVVPSSK